MLMRSFNKVSTSNYVIPLFSKPNESTFIGSAFLANNFLITAGHVVPKMRVYYAKFGDNYYELLPYEWKKAIPSNIDDTLDIAIFPLEKGFKSLFSLSKTAPGPNEELDVICWQQANNSIIKVECISPKWSTCELNIFFRAIVEPRITHGSSGCPILKDGIVYGMLTNGCETIKRYNKYYQGLSKEEVLEQENLCKKTCTFLKSSIILDFIEKYLPSCHNLNQDIYFPRHKCRADGGRSSSWSL